MTPTLVILPVLLALPALSSALNQSATCQAGLGDQSCSGSDSLTLGKMLESKLPNNEVQSYPDGSYAHAISQNKGLDRGEDVIVTSGSNGVYNVSLLMDGHGGQRVVRYAGQKLQGELLRACGAQGVDASGASLLPICAEEAFTSFQDDVRWRRLRGGATAIAVFVKADNSQVAFAWVGDSSALLVRNGDVIYSTSPHTMDSHSEVQRIQSGDFKYLEHDGYLCAPNKACVAPTRALGDIQMEIAGLVAVPEVSPWMDLHPGDIFLAASDGVWDVLEEIYVAKLLKAKFASRTLVAHDDLQNATANLVKLAIRRQIKLYRAAKEVDDVSVIVYRKEVGEEELAS